MKQLYNKQEGLTFIGFLFACALVAFFAYLAMRLWPLYNEKLKVDQALESVAKRDDIQTLNTAALGKYILRHFEIEDVDQFSTLQNMKGIFTVTRVKGKNQRLMGMKYEIRRPLIANLDIVMKYDKTVVIEGTGE